MAGWGSGVPYRRFLCDLSPLQCALTRKAACAPVALAVISATHHDYLNRRPIWPPVTPSTSVLPPPAVTWASRPIARPDVKTVCSRQSDASDAK